MFRFERDGGNPVFQVTLDVRIDARFHAERQECPFGRVADDSPRIVLFLKDGVITQNGSMDEFFQFGIFVHLDHMVVQIEFACREVTGSGHFKQPVRCDDCLHGHFVFGQCTGLVRTDNGYGTEGFDGGQAPDNGVQSRHTLDTQRQRNGHDGWQTFRNGGNGKCHAHQEHVGDGIIPDDRADDEGEHGHGKDADGQPAAEHGDLAQKRRRDFLDLVDHLPDPAEFGHVAGADDNAHRTAVCDQCAGIDHVFPVAQRRIHLDRLDILGDGMRFAGQRRFIDGKAVDVDQADIGGHPVTGSEHDDVTRNEVFTENGHALAVPDDSRFKGEHFADGFKRAFGLAFLYEADDRVDQDDPKDDTGIDPVPQQAGNERRNEQHIDQDIVELQKKAGERAADFGGGQRIQAELMQAFFGFGLCQAIPVDFQPRQHLIVGHGIPGQIFQEKLAALPVFYVFLIQLSLLFSGRYSVMRIGKNR